LNYIEGGFPDITSTNVNGENKMLETRYSKLLEIHGRGFLA
jgi:hypothetical protein